MTENELRALRLSEAMRTALMCTEPGDLMKPGPTRRALVARRLVHNTVASVPGNLRSRLTAEGERARAHLRTEVDW